MIVAHVMGFPLEETVAQFAPVGAVVVTVVAVGVQTQVGRLRAAIRKLSSLVHREYVHPGRSA